MVLKILALRALQFIWGVSSSLHAMKFYRNLSVTKVVFLPSNFLINLASYYMSQTSKEIIFLQKLYCFFFWGFVLFEVLYLRILLRTLTVVLEESSVGLSFHKYFLADLKMPLGLLEYFIFVWFCIFNFQIFYRFWSIFHTFAPFDCLSSPGVSSLVNV